MTASCVYLSILCSCSDDLFSRVPQRILFQVQVTRQCRIQMYFGTVCTVWALKKMFFHVCFTKKQILKKQKNFQEAQISFLKCIEHQILLDIQQQLLRILGVSLNYPILKFKKTVCPKTDGCGTAGKMYFTSYSQAFYTRTRSSYSKARSSNQRCCIKKVFLEIS